MGKTLPLPPPAFPMLREGDMETACWEVDCYTAEQMLAYAAAAVAQERERIAQWYYDYGERLDEQLVPDAIRKSAQPPADRWLCLLCKSDRPGRHGLLDDGRTLCPNAQTGRSATP